MWSIRWCGGNTDVCVAQTKGVIMIEKRETQILLALLAHELFGKELPNNISTNINWEELLQEAKDHVVTALLYDGIKRMEGVPDQVFNRVRGAAIDSAMHFEMMQRIQQKIIEDLAEKRIPCAVLKGTSVACCYPHPELRVPGDIDLLVGRDKVEEACQALETASFVRGIESKKHLDMHRKDAEVELHKIVSEYPELEKAAWLAEYMEDALQHVCRQSLSDGEFPMLTKRYQMISLLTHMADHMEVSGIGLRQLCDWAVTIHRFRNDIGEEDIALLERCGLLRYASVMTRVCEKYLSLPAFEWHLDIEEEIVDVVMTEILESGNFHANRSEWLVAKRMFGLRKNERPEKSSIVLNYLCNISSIVKSNCTWAKSPLWIPLFCAYFQFRWLFRVVTGKCKRASISKAIRIAKTHEKLLYDLKLYL